MKTIAQWVDTIDLCLPDRVKRVFFYLDMQCIGQFIQPTYVVKLSRATFEKKNQTFPYAFNITAQTTTVLVTRAEYTLPKWQFASTGTHLHNINFLTCLSD